MAEPVCEAQNPQPVAKDDFLLVTAQFLSVDVGRKVLDLAQLHVEVLAADQTRVYLLPGDINDPL